MDTNLLEGCYSVICKYVLQLNLIKHEYSSNATLCNIYNFDLDIYMSNSLQSEERA